ncbi:hypothetical protein EB093_05610 [bacterium]|nr:hypothetical protein [bacterium]
MNYSTHPLDSSRSVMGVFSRLVMMSFVLFLCADVAFGRDFDRLESIVQFGLSHNPEVRSRLLQNDHQLMEWTLANQLENPTLVGRFSGGSAQKIEVGIEQPFDISRPDPLPLMDHYRDVSRWSILRVHSLKIAQASVDFAAASAILDARRELSNMIHTAADLAKAQLDAGNISRLDYLPYLIAEYTARTQIRDDERRVGFQTSELRTILGMEAGEPITISSSILTSFNDASVPTAGVSDLNVEEVINRSQIEGMIKSSELRRRVVGTPMAGIFYEHDDGDRLGLAGSVSLPIHSGRVSVDQYQPLTVAISDLAGETIRLSQSNQRTLLIQSIRTLQDQLATYRDHILPIHRELIDETMKHVNYMLKGPYSIIDAAQKLVEARIELIGYQHALARAYLEYDELTGRGVCDPALMTGGK